MKPAQFYAWDLPNCGKDNKWNSLETEETDEITVYKKFCFVSKIRDSQRNIFAFEHVQVRRRNNHTLSLRYCRLQNIFLFLWSMVHICEVDQVEELQVQHVPHLSEDGLI